jgi:hypothetical protein
MHTEFELEFMKVRWEDNVKKNVKEIKGVRMWTQFSWLRMQSSGGLLGTQ